MARSNGNREATENITRCLCVEQKRQKHIDKNGNLHLRGINEETESERERRDKARRSENCRKEHSVSTDVRRRSASLVQFRRSEAGFRRGRYQAPSLSCLSVQCYSQSYGYSNSRRLSSAITASIYYPPPLSLSLAFFLLLIFFRSFSIIINRAVLPILLVDRSSHNMHYIAAHQFARKSRAVRRKGKRRELTGWESREGKWRVSLARARAPFGSARTGRSAVRVTRGRGQRTE